MEPGISKSHIIKPDISCTSHQDNSSKKSFHPRLKGPCTFCKRPLLAVLFSWSCSVWCGKKPPKLRNPNKWWDNWLMGYFWWLLMVEKSHPNHPKHPNHPIFLSFPSWRRMELDPACLAVGMSCHLASKRAGDGPIRTTIFGPCFHPIWGPVLPDRVFISTICCDFPNYWRVPGFDACIQMSKTIETYRNSVRCFEIGHFTNLGCLRLVEHLSTAEGLAGLVGLVKPAHTCPIMHLLLRNSAKREAWSSAGKKNMSCSILCHY